MRIKLHVLTLIIAIADLLFASPVDTLHVQADGKDVPVPYTLQASKATRDLSSAWDSSVTTPLPSWRALATVAESFDACKKDWNQLLVLDERKDSLCQASLATTQHQADLQAERNTNYQNSWKELLANQQQCSQALSTCTSLGKEQAIQLEQVNKSYWWVWLASGLALGLVGGVAIVK